MMGSTMRQFTIFSFVILLVISKICSIPFTSTGNLLLIIHFIIRLENINVLKLYTMYFLILTKSVLDSTTENLNEGSRDEDCEGKPFGTPCCFLKEIEHPTGYCDNSVCISIPRALNDGSKNKRSL